MVQKLSDLSRSPPRTAGGNGPAVRAPSSRSKGRGRALGGSASPYLRPEDRVPSQRPRSRRLRAGVPVPPQVAGSCRNGSNPPLAAPRLSGAAMPPRQPQCGTDGPSITWHAPLQPLQFSAASAPPVQQLPAGGWSPALVCTQAGLEQPPAGRRPKRGAASPAGAEPPKQAAKCAEAPPSPPGHGRGLSPGLVACRTSRSGLALRALPRLELPADCALHVAIASGKATVVLVKPGHPFATAEIGAHALLSGGRSEHRVVQLRFRCSYGGEQLVARAYADWGGRLAPATLLGTAREPVAASSAQALFDASPSFGTRRATALDRWWRSV